MEISSEKQTIGFMAQVSYLDIDDNVEPNTEHDIYISCSGGTDNQDDEGVAFYLGGDTLTLGNLGGTYWVHSFEPVCVSQ